MIQRGAALAAADAADNDYFGADVSLNGEGTVLAVGAGGWEGTVSNQGGVYLFDWNGSSWVQRGSVVAAADATGSDGYGYGVALNGDATVLAVGAYSRSGHGGVYLFDWNGSSWVQRGAVLEAGDAASGDGFGLSVSLNRDGTVLAVGAYSRDGAGSNRGGVYVYDWNGSSWAQRGAVLEAADAADGDGFGIGVSLNGNGDILVVGAYSWEGSVSNQGGVYLYDWNGSSWTQRGGVLTATDAAADDGYGYSVALNEYGEILAVGSYLWEGSVSNQGAVYVYDWNGSAWVERAGVLTASDAAVNDSLGISVSLDYVGAILASGAYTKDAGGTDRGAVYVYDAVTISGSLTEFLTVDRFIGRVYDCDTGELKGANEHIAGSSYAIVVKDGSTDPVFATLQPYYKTAWQASAAVALDDIVFPADPAATPYYYKATVAGTTGASEPAWPATPGNTVVDGGATWQCVERLAQPVTHGPLIPA